MCDRHKELPPLHGSRASGGWENSATGIGEYRAARDVGRPEHGTRTWQAQPPGDIRGEM